MEKLDLKNYEVVALDSKEMKETDGGLIGRLAGWLISAYVASVLSDTEGHANAFKRGYKKGLE